MENDIHIENPNDFRLAVVKKHGRLIGTIHREHGTSAVHFLAEDAMTTSFLNSLELETIVVEMKRHEVPTSPKS